MYEFESYMNLNLKYSNIVVIYIFQIVSTNLKPADTIDLSLMSADLS
jgi:hypothetical protein